MAIDSEPVRLFTAPGRRNAQVYSLGKSGRIYVHEG